MGFDIRLTLSRLKTILARQGKYRWGRDYVPSILATRSEAPARSHAIQIKSARLQRMVHALSNGESFAVALALYQPALLDLHEEKVLYLNPRLHPIEGMPGVTAIGLPPLRGMIDVAERLGYERYLPRITIAADKEKGEKGWVTPVPFIGDLLLFLRAPDRHVYCVNWSIKDKPSGFTTMALDPPKRCGDPKRALKAMVRYEMERTYYADAGIPTVQVASEDLDRHVCLNLLHLIRYHSRSLSIDPDQQQELTEKFKAALATQVTPLDVIRMVRRHHRIAEEDCRTVFYQAIWRRQLRVDLFSPVVIDRPLRPETTDVLVKYQHLFQEQ